MEKNSFWKWLILIVAVAWSMVLVYPINKKLPLGIDLQGGYSFLLEVDYSRLSQDGEEVSKDTKRKAQEQALEVLRNRIDSSGVREPIIYPEPKSLRIVMQIPGVGDAVREEILDLINQPAYLAFRMVHPDNDEKVTEAFATGDSPAGYMPAPFAGRTLYVKDPNYKTDGESVDPDLELAKLESFHRISPAYVFMLSKEKYQNVDVFRPFYVSLKEEMNGQYINQASVGYDQFGVPNVSLSFDSKGGELFGKITEAYSPNGSKNPSTRPRLMAIVLDSTLYSAPQLNEPIYGGSATISGSFDVAEAQQLSIVLRTGALPAPVAVLQQQKVDPTLGRDAIDSGKRAAVIGACAVVLFMLAYYTLGGLIANLALLADLILLPLGMVLAAGFLGIFVNAGGSTGGSGLPTLTLPGIAGLILTIGMAVDANVLIFERIREEQKAGKRFISAVTAGYEKVFSTIFDANITTLLIAVILFMQGSGPIRGFAVTLAAGIIVSMYTALVFTRMLFDLIATKTKIEKVKMFSLVKDTKIDFVGKRKLAAIVSIILILGTWTMLINKGSENLAVDLTGGTAITLAFEEGQEPSVEDIRASLTDVGIDNAFIQYHARLDTGRKALQVKISEVDGEQARSTLLGTYETQGALVSAEETVGSQVGKEMMSKGIKAIIFAILGIVIYISFRFEFAFAMGSIVALVHDVLITVGLFCLFDRQLSLPIVAALLTIVGYSVNDTIVVFDRIREDLKLIKHKSYKEIANISINHTLGRTLLTSVTTLLTVTMLLVFGGGAINDFALALFIGVLVGTYSSVFVATPVMLLWHKGDKANS